MSFWLELGYRCAKTGTVPGTVLNKDVIGVIIPKGNNGKIHTRRLSVKKKSKYMEE